MLFKSAISFASLFILFIELVALPFFLNAGNVKGGSAVFKTETCCAKKSAGGSCSRSSEAGTEGPECCVNCPLFFVMLAPQFIMPDECADAVKRNYPEYFTDYHFTYSFSAWKPPNVC